MNRAAPICVALDSRVPDEIAHLAASCAPFVGMFKVGLTAYVALGSYVVRSLSQEREVFLDLKLHDIPAQVEGAVTAAEATGASLVTVHASGGRDMVRAAVGASDGVKVIAVTILTSLEESDLDQIGLRGTPEEAVLRLAEVALAAGAPGLVCSPLEVAALRSEFGKAEDGGPLLIVPGIRPSGSEVGDQRRTLTPREALDAGADVLVIGRPITGAADPGRAAEELAAELL